MLKPEFVKDTKWYKICAKARMRAPMTGKETVRMIGVFETETTVKVRVQGIMSRLYYDIPVGQFRTWYQPLNND